MSTTTQTLLYKMDSRNKIREWCIWTELNKVIIRHGETNASKTFETITCDSIDDAIVQADRRIAKQKDRRGYTTHIPITKPLLPMLANRAQEHMSKIPDKVAYQPKLDGYRCLGSFDRMRTRTNSPLPVFPQIKKALAALPPEIVLDGELYSDNKRFQQIMKSRAQTLTYDSVLMEYHVYDLVDENVKYSSRRTLLAEIVLELQDAYEKDPYVLNHQPIPFPIMPVQTYIGKSSELLNYQAKFVAAGYEGTIIRNLDSCYEIDTRSYGLLKYKESDLDWCRILSTEPGRTKKTEGVLVCDYNGQTFRASLNTNHEERKKLLIYPHLYIGKAALVEYYGLTDKGVPRNATAKEIA